MNDQIFTPAEMNHSTFVMTEDFFPSIALPYRNASAEPEETLLINDLSTGSMFSTASDMARFMHIILEGGDAFLNDEYLMQMVDVTDFEFSETWGGATHSRGLGFIHRESSNGVIMVGHVGAWQHHSMMWLNLEGGIGVFISVNSDSGRNVPRLLADLILESAIDEKQGNE